jgi:glucose/arabinose dehydrogenase
MAFARFLRRMCAAAVVSFAVCVVPVVAAPPAGPAFTEPGADGAVLNPADVHMAVGEFSDPDGHAHTCSDWQIWSVSSSELAWQALCATGLEKVHIHLGDGTFQNSHAGRTELNFDSSYRLRARFRDSAGELSSWSVRPFRTSPAGPPGEPSEVPWAARQPGYRVEKVAGDFQLPVNIAFVPEPGSAPGDPFFYVTELYGTIKVVSRSGTVTDYASGLLNFDPTGQFPGSGEQGLTGIVVDPVSKDVFASMVYEDTLSPANPKPHYPKVVRFHSIDGGRTAATRTTIIDMAGESEGQSHQISNLTIGPDGKLYVHNGDGFETATAQNLDSFRGKVLRMNLNGSPVAHNPFYNASDGTTARDYVFAYGLRNPFGGAWRAADGSHYEVENGPSVDRFARVVGGRNFGWDGSDASMRNFALYGWDPAHAPVNIAFVEPQTAFGSGFTFEKMDHAYVSESGPTYATGPQQLGKRIVEFSPASNGSFAGRGPVTLVEYTGTGKATAAGLAAGPDGLYFTDLYKDLNFTSPIDRGANVLRVRYVGPQLGTGTGLRGRYHDNPDFTGFRLARTDARVNFDWGSGSPDPAIGPESFSVLWRGRIEPLHSETYTLYTVSDEGVRLWLNGRLLIDNWISHPPTENSARISLVGGRKYFIRIDYREDAGGAVAKLLWSSPSQPKQVIPRSQLYPP